MSGFWKVLISMHSILGWASFCMNYWINAAWHGGDQSVTLLRWYGSPGFFDSGLQVTCIVGSGVSHLPLDNTPYILYGVQVRGVCWPMKHSNTMVIEPAFGTFGSVDRCRVLLENEISISIKLVGRRKHEVLKNFLVDVCIDCGLQKTQWTNTSRWHGSPNHHRLWKLNTGLQATWILCLSTLPPDSGTLISKWNAKCTFIWKEDFGPLRNSPVIFSLAHVRCFWKCPKCLNRLCLTVFSSLGSSLLLVHIFLPNFFLTVNFAFNMLWYNTPFSNDPLWLTLFVEGVNDHLLDHFQVSSVPHYCGFKERDTHNLYCMAGHLLKPKCKYSNILRYSFLIFISCKL